MIDIADRAAILDLLAELEQGWRDLDFARIRRLWDPAHDPIYFAEEAAQPRLDWEQLQAYWDFTGRAIEKMGMNIVDDPVLRELAPGLVTAIYRMHWDALVRGESRPMGGDNRVCATFRRTPAGWKFAQYVEAPLAPIAYIRELYEKAATPGFAARP